jgi:type IV pilus assembly protein PilP
MRHSILFLALLSLAGCSREPNGDLRQWVQDSGNGLRSQIEPLPEVKAYEPFSYEAFNMQDPFKPRRLEEEKKRSDNPGPDLTRRKELLESYPLDQLKFVGTLEQGKKTFALVKAEDTIHRVKAGNYLGQNFGLIMGVSDTEVKLKESIQDSEGEWKETETALQLIEDQQQEKKK